MPENGERSMRRLFGLDAARAVAVVGMIAVHLGSLESVPGGGPAQAMLHLPGGRASVMFMVLAGIGVSLMLRSAKMTRRRLTTTLLWRGSILFLAGLALQLLDHGVSVILAIYGVLFIISTLLARVPNRLIFGSALFFLLAGPFTLVLVESVTEFDVRLPRFGDDIPSLISSLLITGSYPLVTWVVPFLVGLWLGSHQLGAPRVQLRLVLVGLALFLTGDIAARLLVPVAIQDGAPFGLNRLASGAAHSNMPLWLTESIGTACVGIGLLLALERLFPRARRWLWPLCAFGQLALTFYVGHLLLIAWVLRPSDWPTEAWPAVGILGLILVLGLVFSPWWLKHFRYGPTEYLMHLPSLFHRTALKPDPTTSGHGSIHDR